MRLLTARALAAALLLALSAPALAAFDPFEWEPVPEDPRSYEAVRERYAPVLEVYDYPTVLLALQAEAEGSPHWQGGEPVYRRLLQALDELTGRFAAVPPPAPGELGGGEGLDRLLARVDTGLFQCVGEKCFSGRPFEVAFEDLAALPQEQGEDFRYRVDTVGRLLWELKKPALRENVAAIRDARERWDVFVEEAMSQYPWEAVFNTYLAPEGTIEFPPSRQWIFLHPEVGVEVSTDGLKDLRADLSLAVEVLGHTWYRWKKRGDPGAGLRWWGVAAAATLRDAVRRGGGWGGRYGRLWTLGVVWHDDDEDDRWFDQAPYVLFGVDLFRLVEDRAPEYQRKWQQALETRDRFLRGR